MTPRSRWLLQQIEKGIVRADFTRWSIMRPHEYQRKGAERGFSVREQDTLLAGKLVEIEGIRLKLTQRGDWLLNRSAAKTGGVS